MDSRSLDIYRILKRTNPVAAKDYFDKYTKRFLAEGRDRKRLKEIDTQKEALQPSDPAFSHQE